jgi:hypothetical protein
VATVVPMPTNDPVVYIDGDDLVITDFRESDPEVLSVMREADDLPAAVHRGLAIGARALRAEQVSVDSAVVEREFDEMRVTFRRSVEEFADEIATKADELLDGEEGKIPKTLVEFRDGVETLLDTTFDPNNKQSAVTKLETVLTGAGREQVAAMRRLIDPENEESPLARYRSEIVKEIEKKGEAILQAFAELKTQLAVEEAKAVAFDQSAAKGFSFEDLLDAALTEIAAGFEDVAERVGGTPGGRGRKGDFVVTLNPSDTNGESASYVLEAKDTPKKLPEILKELDQAMANRGAVAAIAVFARPEQSPIKLPFHPFDNKAVVVLDKDAPDELALRLACCWARWIARRNLAKAADDIDLGRIAGLIEAARQGLATTSKIRTALNGSKTQIDRALGHVESLVVDVESALQGIEDEVAS